MARMELEEFRYLFIQQDPKGVAVIVEGIRDARFLEIVVPTAQRLNASVYPITEIEIPGGVLGGERGRVLWLASTLAGDAALAGRIYYLIDADSDRFMHRTYPPGVVLSDLSDHESYALEHCCLDHILYTFGKPASLIGEFRSTLISICRPIKLLRAAAAALDISLSINQTLGENHERFRRYILGRELDSQIDAKRLADAVFSNTGLDHDSRNLITDECSKLNTTPLDPSHFVQGKDLIAAFASILRVGIEEAGRHVGSAMRACVATLRCMPSLSTIDGVLRR